MRKETRSNSIPEKASAAISAAHLLHPAKHFAHPRDVLAAAHIGNEEKRAILASWASDMFAIESVPALRLYPGTDKPVSYDEIIEALKSLDDEHQQLVTRGSPVTFDIRKNHCRRPEAHRLRGLGLWGYRKGQRRRQPFEI
jgi:hypothetical protein